MAENVRQRRPIPDQQTTTTEDARQRKLQDYTDEEDNPPITVLDIVRIIAGLITINLLLSYLITGNSVTWGYNPWWIRPQAILARFRPPLILTETELLVYSGTDPSLPLLLALNGTIYDVSASRHIYGPDGMYSHFGGRDATRAFITGCFREDAVADYRGAEWTYVPQDVPRYTEVRDEELEVGMRERRRVEVEKALKAVEETVEGWAKMFRGETGKAYFEVGRVKRARKWLEVLPLRPLCETAEKGRPKAVEGEAVDAGARYRG